MSRAYIDQVDLTDNGKVVVSGHLAHPGLVASLNQRVYVTPPADGVFEYDLVVSAVGQGPSPMILVPFSAEAAAPGGEANGVRIIQQPAGGGELITTTLLQVRRVDTYTDANSNHVLLEGAVVHQGMLVLRLVYGGGCRSHTFSVEWDGLTLESNPPQYVLNVVDSGPYDPCKGLIPTELRIDLDVPGIDFDRPSTLVVRTPSGGELRVALPA